MKNLYIAVPIYIPAMQNYIFYRYKWFLSHFVACLDSYISYFFFQPDSSKSNQKLCCHDSINQRSVYQALVIDILTGNI